VAAELINKKYAMYGADIGASLIKNIYMNIIVLCDNFGSESQINLLKNHCFYRKH